MTATINASTSSGVVITPDNSGAIALQNNGTNGLVLSSSGQMTVPLQPAFCAVRTGGLTNLSVNTSNTAPTIVPWDSTTVNTGSCFSTSTNRFTAPIAGRYLFTVSVSWYAASSNEKWAAINLLKNGSNVGDNFMGMTNLPYSTYASSTYSSSSGSLMLTLAANDYIQVGAFSQASTAVVWNYGCYFNGFLIG